MEKMELEEEVLCRLKYDSSLPQDGPGRDAGIFSGVSFGGGWGGPLSFPSAPSKDALSSASSRAACVGDPSLDIFLSDGLEPARRLCFFWRTEFLGLCECILDEVQDIFRQLFMS